MEFPKLERKFGDEVTYEDNPKDHIRTEFGFDVTQVAKNHYTSDRYHDFIGFEVSKPVLERAFLDTYGIPLSDVIPNEDLAIGTFRRAISTIIPEMTRVALVARKKEIVEDTPNFNARKFRYNLSRADYQREWGKGYRRPGFGTRILAFFLRFVPKVGPFKALDFKIPTQQTEDLYVASVNHTLDNYRSSSQGSGDEKAFPAEHRFRYWKRYRGRRVRSRRQGLCIFARQTSGQEFRRTRRPRSGENILAYYSNPAAPNATKRDPAEWQKTQDELQRLKDFTPPQTPAAKVASSF